MRSHVTRISVVLNWLPPWTTSLLLEFWRAPSVAHLFLNLQSSWTSRQLTLDIYFLLLAGFMLPSKRAVVSKHLSAVGRASSSVSGFRGVPSNSLRAISVRRNVFASKGRVAIPVFKPRILHRSYASESHGEFPCPVTIVVLNVSEKVLQARSRGSPISIRY